MIMFAGALTAGIFIVIGKNNDSDTTLFKQKSYKENKDMITTKEIATHFKTNSINVNKVFSIILYAEKSAKWWVATKEGLAKGAEQKYNTKSKQKYIIWNKCILDDEDFVKTMQALLNSCKKEEPAKFSKEYTDKKIKVFNDNKKTVKTSYKEK